MHQYFKGRKILITGGLGFIGSALAHRLVELESQVTLVDSLIPEYGGNLFNIERIKTQVKVNIADVRDKYSMSYLVKDHDLLFNLAGQTSHLDSIRDPYTDLDINCRSQLSILEACRENNPNIKLIFASTRQLYGVAEYLPVDEKHPLRPVDVNGINKMAGEWYHILYSNIHGIRAGVLRLTNTYGPRMRIKDARQTFLGSWIRQIISGEDILIYGDGEQLRDFNYVDDVVDALLLVGLHKEADGKVFNLGATPAISLKNLADLLVEINRGGTLRYVAFPKELKSIDIGDYYADYSLISRTLGWEPKISLNVGLSKTIEYFREYSQFYW
jgi:UDP-glucose 4-epimerase